MGINKMGIDRVGFDKVGINTRLGLGLEGVDCLRHTIHTVPEGFLTIYS